LCYRWGKDVSQLGYEATNPRHVRIASRFLGPSRQWGEEVIHGEVSVSYPVRWADGHQTLIAPKGGSCRGRNADALGPAPRAELLHVLMLPDFDRIGSYWGYPESLIDCEEDRVVVGTLRERPQ
jgi:hypothetical protein